MAGRIFFTSQTSWQAVLDEPYLLAAARYVELNPLRAGLNVAPGDCRWSSARAHLKKLGPVLRRQNPGPKKVRKR